MEPGYWRRHGESSGGKSNGRRYDPCARRLFVLVSAGRRRRRKMASRATRGRLTPAASVEGSDSLLHSATYHLLTPSSLERTPTVLVRPLTAPVKKSPGVGGRPKTSPIRQKRKSLGRQSNMQNPSQILYTPITDRKHLVKLKTHVIIGDVVTMQQKEEHRMREANRLRDTGSRPSTVATSVNIPPGRKRKRRLVPLQRQKKKKPVPNRSETQEDR